MEWMSILLVILLAAALIVLEYSLIKAGRFWEQLVNTNRTLYLIFSCARIIMILCAAIFGLSLPLLLLALGALCMLPVKLTGNRRYEAQLGYLIPYLVFISILLCLIGAAALAGGSETETILQNLYIRTGIFLATTCFVCMLLRLLRPMMRSQFLELEHDRRQDDLFLRFLWCGVIYVLLDSVFCIINAGMIVSILLIAGNVLLFLLVVLFFKQKWMIAEKRRLEDEHRQLEAERAREQIKRTKLEQSLKHDVLTGCFSRRYVIDYLKGLKGKRSFSIAFIDMDGLKKINDERGHQEGDRMLIRFAAELRARLTDKEVLARVGGDEFLLVLPDISFETAKEKMEALRGAFLDLEIPISFSYGVACGNQEIDTLIKDADAAMYQDKKRLKKGGEIE